MTAASGTVLPWAVAARCSLPGRQWSDSAGRPLLGTEMIGTATIGAATSAASPVLKPDLNIGLRIELGMAFSVESGGTKMPDFNPAHGRVAGARVRNSGTPAS